MNPDNTQPTTPTTPTAGNVQSIIANFKSANPSYASTTPSAGGTDWYSQVKAGAYNPTTPPTPTPQPQGGGFMNEAFGNAPATGFVSGLVKNTIGEQGIGGLAARPIVSAATTGAEGDVAQHSQQLAQVTQALIKKVQTMSPDDPKRQGLLDLVKENQKSFGISSDEMNALEGVQETQGQNLGTALNAGATLAGGAEIGGAATGARTIGQSIVHGIGAGADVGAATGAGQALQDKNANLGDVAKGTAIGALTGAVTGGITEGTLGGIKAGVGAFADRSANAADRAAQKTTQTTLEDATPAYSKKIIGDPAIKNPDGTVTPRVVEGGLKGRTVTPTALETDAGTALSKIEGYPTNGTALEKYQAVAPEIAKQGQALRASLANETVVRTRGEMMDIVKKAVNGVPENSMSLSKTDPIISNYLRVASNAVDGKSQSLAGELEFSNKLDQAYENARGKLAFGSDKISALDEIHTAARNALKQDLINSAENTDVKAALKSQWDLYRAQDVLRDKAEAEGGTSIERQMQKHPVITKIAKGAVHASGLGAAIHLIP
jgi:hypothetical protein